MKSGDFLPLIVSPPPRVRGGTVLLLRCRSVAEACFLIGPPNSVPLPMTNSCKPVVSCSLGLSCSFASGFYGPNIEFFLEEMFMMSFRSS